MRSVKPWILCAPIILHMPHKGSRVRGGGISAPWYGPTSASIVWLVERWTEHDRMPDRKQKRRRVPVLVTNGETRRSIVALVKAMHAGSQLATAYCPDLNPNSPPNFELRRLCTYIPTSSMLKHCGGVCTLLNVCPVVLCMVEQMTSFLTCAHADPITKSAIGVELFLRAFDLGLLAMYLHLALSPKRLCQNVVPREGFIYVICIADPYTETCHRILKSRHFQTL
ncbi:uncharacterized protein EI90DRAFT_3079229 [Cantharellus anzutake]|uniref:uncharacterized protein n=1 Tax=Cantharellus anzutake TaxID=1750568 RepID=UPI00190870C0|nr:uncharacterized protein EI90DRAFT_3079229 [Cantharellus anzutake]KAF8321385.1 hypothetical protein EI90DRAFT_3079229 [Cantharellus anzutake]